MDAVGPAEIDQRLDLVRGARYGVVTGPSATTRVGHAGNQSARTAMAAHAMNGSSASALAAQRKVRLGPQQRSDLSDVEKGVEIVRF